MIDLDNMWISNVEMGWAQNHLTRKVSMRTYLHDEILIGSLGDSLDVRVMSKTKMKKKPRKRGGSGTRSVRYIS